ncbi:asparagine synthase-related protein [Sphingomonas asaccharolytica]|uniref:asparagine synthase-related protein n=1 Tax=Sphingomonas asaccharolytica TaxID=40681 RepID=UPI000831A5E5|nr:asparagine synthase-related protein [Sphingomonas asaccharolytica]
MSAICGILRFDGADVTPRTVDRMAHRMKHRGADGVETIDLGRLALGHCLMRVNREDVHEAQPIVARDAVLVADLRLDNREELASTLGIAADDLAVLPDSEILLRAWRHWGESCTEYLLGDFAFALWDRTRGRLLLARDHMGQRTLFYHRGEGFIAFASELPALFAADGVPRRLDEDELARRLLRSTQRIEGEFLYQGITVLPGGTRLIVASDGTVAPFRFWRPHAGQDHIGKDDTQLIAAYRATIEEAVACRVRRLINPATLLFSGGFDSGTIAVIAGPLLNDQGRSLICASSVLPEGDSRRNARAAVEAFRGLPGLDIRYYVRGDESPYDDLEGSFAATGLWHAPSVARRGIGRIARAAGSRLALDGHGGDYTVNPYDTAMLGAILRKGHLRRFAREFIARMRFTGWSPVRVAGRDVISAFLPQRVQAGWRNAVNGFVPAWRRRGVQLDFARDAITRRAVDSTLLRDGYRAGARWRDRWEELCHRMSASAIGSNYGADTPDLDLTRPFHDKRVVELAFALPDHLLFHDGRERWLARTAFADLLPVALVRRGPGNDSEEPDRLAMNAAAAPAMLAALRDLEQDEAVSRYIDVAALTAMVANSASDERKSERIRLNFAMAALTKARFLGWLDRSNL